MKRWIKYAIAAVIIAIIAAIFYNKIYVVKSTFKTIKPTIGDLHVGVRGIGNVDAKNIYTITAQSGGKIESIFVDEGEWVKKGDTLLTIDAVDAPMLLDEAKLLLNKAKNEAKASKNNLESLQAQKSLIQATFNRYEKLIEQKFATGAEYDKAKSDLQNINAQIEASKAQIASAASEEKRVQKSIEAIEAKLDRLKIYSPVDGYVITKEAEQSQYVLPSTAIFKIVDANTLWVKTNIDERLANQIKLNQKASITLRSKPNEKLLGSVDRIVASSNLVTLEREIAVKFDEIPKPFYINEQAEVNIEVADYKNVLKIPLNLLVTNNGKKGVWVARGENAYFESISISAQNDEEVAVSSGIDENTELLIYKPNNKPLSDGMKIFR
ncbi:MAG: efflux transporter periplasmic adaptor subunit [Sulfurimonas sp. RIFOXYD12_FULL_33_39]|uniref:efflux RND transporter periplasmic adaptor subunit n=1 Tax=unclassified Sulfurimonas TaxID=2623549 RepID=UPI0008ACF26B|nr:MULTISPECIES: efflux RND transporter periplasmic adaptor subunit [unclassified Sulfurimonas]OHE10088.1 MAG: efflux transporter periplasmic adaptor subunit [Sulfurimonas sp. RIFOXYD12_FULL_33_39]OHE14691.1 MAG: efflux transporter periplasmic adaptor subunit [Sulfurimonas sp. RIFOXYD2_FULL_34_21]DAB28780.1 MAG TPA: efflux transporter periplasmic adaptor subunit [Sulfurimonas sp. UBA10385]